MALFQFAGELSINHYLCCVMSAILSLISAHVSNAYIFLHLATQVILLWQCDNDNLKSHKCVCITAYHPDTKSNRNPNPNPNTTTKQHAIVNIQLNIVTCPMYPAKFIRDNVAACLCRCRL